MAAQHKEVALAAKSKCTTATSGFAAASFKGQGSQGSQGSQGAIVCNAAEGMSAIPGRERVGREARVDLRAQDGHRGPCDEESEESEELGRRIHVA